MCTVLLDLPPVASQANPLKPAVVWETLDSSGRAHHVDVLHSTDGGATFDPIVISPGKLVTDLPLAGSFNWETVTSFPIGELILVRTIAFDASGNEVCRSQLRTIRVTA